MMGSNHWTSRIDPAIVTEQCIVYKDVCTDCSLTYIGFMQCMFKRQVVEHISGARGHANENTSALSAHMVLGKHWQDPPLNEKPSLDQI
eukprot:15273855-Ditylum_brightwellii.AAC.1